MQPDREPKGNPPKKIAYLCDREKECNKHWDCGRLCKHTTYINHAVNFINLGNKNYVEERPETPTIDAIPIEWIMHYSFDGEKQHPISITKMIADWRKENAETD